mmetsp:Transcript_42148/g.106073  ORF Transcript_42148/g.106073 Transcript_42148/m.106073 type:complete len:350 (+) Transcript_42148:90-1139(+)|eukprot:CAMPEP_0115219984 /NCGR_PEP_ID=MMETSP0270-20121206/27211_1 /TAXON_ID=71861 /ORGANISM="Scrippsiella trochoidea, Strain CCMP3099" /LENGTH=349 /DNA_ID=CAMNT_0002634021 /DNA_START=90 /DNA_END=1139 /DNA_ORIENTATION=+
MSGFDYSKWDKIELSDDEDDLHPNIDKDSWFRLKHRNRVEKEEDDGKKTDKLEKRLATLRKEYDTFPESAKGHMKAQKVDKEIKEIEAELEKMEKQRKWNADNMCKTSESRTEVNSSGASPAPGPEPRLQGEAVADGYCEFVEENEELLEKWIAMGDEDDLEKVCEFMKVHGGTLLQGEHAESYLLLDCLEKEMNGMHKEMKRSARQSQLLTQLREFSRASGRPARDGVVPVFQRLLDHEGTKEAFDDSVADFVRRIEKRAPEKKKEMDKEMEEAEKDNPAGPGGLDPMEVFRSLPGEMQAAFQAKDIQRLNAAVEALPPEEAKYHLKRCEDSGLWVPNPEAGPPPYRG